MAGCAPRHAPAGFRRERGYGRLRAVTRTPRPPDGLRSDFRTSAFAGALGTAAFSAGMFLGRTGFGSYVPQRHLKRLIVTVGLFGAAVSALVVPFSYLVMVALVLAAAPARRGRSG